MQNINQQLENLSEDEIINLIEQQNSSSSANVHNKKSQKFQHGKLPETVGETAQIRVEAINTNENTAINSISASIAQKVNNLNTHLASFARLPINSADSKFSEEFKQKAVLEFQKIHRKLKNNILSLTDLSNRKKQLIEKLKAANFLSEVQLDLLSGKTTAEIYQTKIQNLNLLIGENTLSVQQKQVLLNPKAAGFEDFLNSLVNNNHLTSEQLNLIKNILPKTEAEETELLQQATIQIQSSDLENNTDFSHLQNELKAETSKIDQDLNQIIEEYLQITDHLALEIKEYYSNLENAAVIYDLDRDLIFQTGLNIKPGAVFWAENWNSADQNNKPHNVKVTVNDINFDFKRTDPLTGNVNSHNFRNDLSFSPEIPQFEPNYELTIEYPDGQKTKQKFSQSGLNNFINNFNLVEKIDDEAQLSQQLNLSETLQVGQSYNYPFILLNPENQEKQGDENREFTIKSLNNGHVTFEDPIEFQEVNPDTNELETKSIQTMPYQDFAKWYRRLSVNPKLESVEQTNQELQKVNQKFIELFKLDPNLYPAIDLNAPKPLALQSIADSNNTSNPETYFIQSAGPDGVELGLDNPEKISLNDFLRNVENRFLTPVSPEIAAERLQKYNEIKEGPQALIDQAEQEKEKLAAAALAQQAGKTAKKPSQAQKSSIGAYFKSLWGDVHFLNMMEIVELYWKAPIEEFKSVLKDGSERKVANIGRSKLYQGLPWPLSMVKGLNSTYEDKYNAKGAEDVKSTLEWLEKNKDTDGVKEIVYGTDDKVELIACLKFLASKGAIRDDDLKLHATLNRVLGGPVYPKEQLYPKQYWGKKVVIGDGLDDGLHLIDQQKLIIDEAYGKGTFDGLFATNNSKYREKRDATNADLHDKYEFSREGIGVEIQKRMLAFMNGEKVDAAEFDGMLLGAITKDEISPEQWLMTLVFAFGYKNKNGKTLLAYERYNPYIKDLRKIPYFLWFALKYNLVDENGDPIVDKDGKPVRGHIKVNELNKIFKDVMQKDINANLASGMNPDDPKVFSAGKNTIKWMHQELLTHPAIIEKAGENAGDNEQSKAIGHYVIPVVTNPDDLNKILSTGYGGRSSVKAVKMGMCGYGSQLKARIEILKNSDADKRKAAINNFVNQFTGFIYFDSTIRGLRGRNKAYIRLKDTDMADPVEADKKRDVIEFAKENRQFIYQVSKKFAQKTGDHELDALTEKVLNPSVRDESLDQEEDKLREILNKKMREFAATNFNTFIDIIEPPSRNIVGLSGLQITKEEKEAMEEAKMQAKAGD